ncbi:hypothetical protein M422DRAFT_260447 [Sphaerobolus stellatus SS14]|uniref:FAD/NAD(P)-binding domain-containing protein n=1 Tax=Sphaerobolus stellatus (strain SS14) TaxID=990650 RepID=A0A0C9UQQ3_SPHS4|nr:hypothetical protein M422DRAFT_260447 [Sphaerobolus stellatus SS14]
MLKPATRPSALRRVFEGSRGSYQSFSVSAPARHSKERLVIVGSGWGGYEVLRKVDKKQYVTLISANTYFAFTPLLASCAVGTLEYRTALEPVSIPIDVPSFTYQPRDRLELSPPRRNPIKLDFRHKTLECTPATPVTLHENVKEGKKPTGFTDDRGNPILGPKFTIGYDKLVIAVGAYAQSE